MLANLWIQVSIEALWRNLTQWFAWLIWWMPFFLLLTEREEQQWGFLWWHSTHFPLEWTTIPFSHFALFFVHQGHFSKFLKVVIMMSCDGWMCVFTRSVRSAVLLLLLCLFADFQHHSMVLFDFLCPSLHSCSSLFNQTDAPETHSFCDFWEFDWFTSWHTTHMIVQVAKPLKTRNMTNAVRWQMLSFSCFFCERSSMVELEQ